MKISKVSGLALLLMLSMLIGCIQQNHPEISSGLSSDITVSDAESGQPLLSGESDAIDADNTLSGEGIQSSSPDATEVESIMNSSSQTSAYSRSVSETSPAAMKTYSYQRYSWEAKVESSAGKYAASTVTFDFASIGVSVRDAIYSAGYDGWGDITEPRSISALKEIRLKYLRIPVELGRAAGNTPGGEVDIACIAPKDGSMPLIDRIRTAQKNGFTPILALSSNYDLPSYFHPETDKLSYWFQYNLDGTKASSGIGNQVDECARIAGEIARKLKAAGVSGLMWESIFEIGYGYPPFNDAPAYIHYKIAKAIKTADAASRHIGPATFTGWSVEKFVDDYFEIYGADGARYLDYVSFHQYGGNFVWNRKDIWDYTKQYVSMVQSDYHTQNGLPIKNLTLLKLLSSVPLAAADSVRALKVKLAQKAEQYSFDKKIGVSISEYDVNNYSNYMHNPTNADYPDYSAASDTSINTNYFGGVNTAYLLTTCSLAGVDMMIKFNTRSYYGIVDNDCANYNLYYRTPVWYSFKLLQEKLGLTGSAEIVEADVSGPLDTVSDFGKPWIFACSVKKNGKMNLLFINRGDTPLKVIVQMKGLPTGTSFTRYVYSERTTADYIGNDRPSGNEYDGIFKGGINDGWSDFNKNLVGDSDNICLFPMGEILPSNQQTILFLDKFSYIVLQMN